MKKNRNKKIRVEDFAHGAKGARLPGWHEVNVLALAKTIGVSAKHLRLSLAGRANCNLSLIEKVGEHLGITPSQVVERIMAARAEDDIRKSFRSRSRKPTTDREVRAYSRTRATVARDGFLVGTSREWVG